MKQNSKEKYWREIEDRNYVAVMDADPKLVVKLFDIARGNTSLEKFLHNCKLSNSCISNLVYGEGKRLHVKDIFLVMQHLPEGSPVTEELLLAANGLYRKKKVPVATAEMERSINELREKIRSLDEPVKKRRFGKAGKPEKKPKQKIIEMPKVDNTFSGYENYDVFIDDLAFYGKRQPNPILLFLKENQEQLFANINFCKALSLYRKYATTEMEQRISDFKDLYATGTDLPERGSVSERYKLILDTFVNQKEAGK